MGFKEKLNKSYEEKVEEVYLEAEEVYLKFEEESKRAIARCYKPLFQGLKNRAIIHMKSRGIEEIPLKITCKEVVFRNDERFYRVSSKRFLEKKIKLYDLGVVYLEESCYHDLQQDSRRQIPSFNTLMKNALIDFKESIKESIERR